MKRQFTLLLLLLAIIPARAQYMSAPVMGQADGISGPSLANVSAPSLTGSSGYLNNDEVDRCLQNLENSRSGEICFMSGIGVMAAGFIGGMFVTGAEHPNKALSIASEVALVGGAGAAGAGALLMFCREIPGYRIKYCAPYTTGDEISSYIRGTAAAKGLISAGVGLFGAGLGTYLVMYHRGTAFEGNNIYIHSSMQGAGFLLVLAGSVVAVISDNHYCNLAKREWKRRGCPEASLTVGPTNSGVGLAYNF
jgi:hypothetical protein